MTLASFLALLWTAAPLSATERTGAVRVIVAPDRDDWRYTPGAPATFSIRVERDGHALKGAKLRYRVGPEQLTPTIDQTVTTAGEPITTPASTLEQPGFLRCVAEVEVGGRTYRSVGTAGFSPEAIKPTVDDPAEFDAYWAAGKKQLAALPVDAKVTPMPERSTATVDCHHVSVQNVPAGPPGHDGRPPPPTRIYGVLCEPHGPGPFPALLSVPGAGVRAYRGLAGISARGVITLQVGIHGLPVNLDDEVYDSLAKGALAGYNAFNADDRERYYYRRVYLGMLRANDFLASRPRWDRKQLGVIGGSQGGALALVTAALDPRVRALVAYYPALSDLPGYAHGRAGGWPGLRREASRTPEKLSTLAFFDVVNFARRVKVPGFYSWGFNDEVCPPTSMFAAYNVIGAPKKLLLALETGHHTQPEQSEVAEDWIFDALTPKKRPPVAGKAPASAAR